MDTLHPGGTLAFQNVPTATNLFFASTALNLNGATLSYQNVANLGFFMCSPHVLRQAP